MQANRFIATLQTLSLSFLKQNSISAYDIWPPKHPSLNSPHHPPCTMKYHFDGSETAFIEFRRRIGIKISQTLMGYIEAIQLF